MYSFEGSLSSSVLLVVPSDFEGRSENFQGETVLSFPFRQFLPSPVAPRGHVSLFSCLFARELVIASRNNASYSNDRPCAQRRARWFDVQRSLPKTFVLSQVAGRGPLAAR